MQRAPALQAFLGERGFMRCVSINALQNYSRASLQSFNPGWLKFQVNKPVVVVTAPPSAFLMLGNFAMRLLLLTVALNVSGRFSPDPAVISHVEALGSIAGAIGA
jgi:hypothetical protein